MANECDSQGNIKFYLEAFLPYICECVSATDLLVHLPYFDKSERKEIFPLSTSRPIQATKLALETLLKKNDPGIYMAIKEAMGPDQANIPKIFDILSGKSIPSQEEEQYTAVIQLFMNEIVGRINPSDIIPYLKMEGALGIGDIEEIKCEERNYGQRRAAWLLLYYLPQRVEAWFKVFLKALIAEKQDDLAEKLDPDLYSKITAQLKDDIECKNAEATEEQESVLEVFEDAVDDVKLLNALEEKCDQETSGTDSTKDTSTLVKTDETSEKLSTASIETELKVINESDTLHDTGLGSSPESRTDKLSSYCTRADSEHTLAGKRNPVKDNLDSAGESKLSDKKILQNNENTYLLSEDDDDLTVKRRLPVFNTITDVEPSAEEITLQVPRVPDTRPKEKPRLTLKYDSNFLRRLQHSKLACYPAQAFLRLPELFDNESKSKLPAASFETTEKRIVIDRNSIAGSLRMHRAPMVQTSQHDHKRTVDTMSGIFTEKKAAVASVKQSSSLPETFSLDLTGFLLPDTRPKDMRVESVGCDEMADTALKDLIASLNDCVLMNGDNRDTPSVIYSRNDDNSPSEVENDLNANSAAPSVATDFDNIENQTENEIPLREYQKELARDGCEGENVIILAPTNSGKTWVACRIIQEHFRKSWGNKIAKCAFVVENTALAQQQGDCCAELLSHLRTKVISGETQRDKKEYLKDFVDRRDILVVTAKVLHNTLKQKEIDSITKFSLIVFDECHHTQSDHPYNEIMYLYHDAKSTGIRTESLPQIVGLTASLGVGGGTTIEKTVKHMQSLMANLDAKSLCRVKKNQRELEQYQNNPDEEIVVVLRRVNDSFRGAASAVMRAIEGLLKQTKEHMIPADVAIINKLMKSIPAEKGSQAYIQWLSDLMKGLVALDSEDMRRVLNSCRLHLIDYNQAILLYTDARVEDALDILMKTMEQRRSPGNNRMEEIMLRIYDHLTKQDFKACSFNPKLTKIKEILLNVLGETEDARGIIFVKTRQLAEYMIKWMKETDGLKDLNPTGFVGQTASVQVGGMTKHEQKDVLEYFKDGLHKLIVATSVAEEGLDITKCNLVIRYEHVTNEIVRTQSRGRARAPGSRYYVITGQGSPIADKEEKNAIAEKLMNNAVVVLERLIERNRNDFEVQQNKLQLSDKIKRETKAKRKAERLIEGDFEFRCLHCSNFICMSSDIKKIQGCHHVCVADDVNERVTFQRSIMPEFEENDMKMDGATYCNNCLNTLGGVCDYKGIEFPLIKVSLFRLVDANGKGSHTKKWKGAPCKIEEIELEDLRKFANRNNDSD